MPSNDVSAPKLGRVGPLQALGLPASAMRSFVLDNDPVPRAMLSADPAFALLKQSAPVAWLLQAREFLCRGCLP